MSRLPLDLYAEVETGSGARFRWDANQAPGSRLRNFSFRTKIGEGFSDANGQLARRIDQDYPDLGLVNTVTIVGADGSVAYEGRISSMPRDLSDTHSIGVTLVGWMAHAKDRKFNEVYVDRSFDVWRDPSVTRKAALLGASISMGDLRWDSSPGGLVCALPNQALGTQTIGELGLTAPRDTATAFVKYRGVSTNTPAGYVIRIIASDNDNMSAEEQYGLTLDDTLRTITLTTVRKHLAVYEYSNGNAATPAAGAGARISKLAVYGNHGLTLRAGETGEPEGVYASDVIRNIAARWCPKLDTSGVQDSFYVIQHLAFRDRTFPYDAFLEINKYHLFRLGVWENKRLDFGPYDLSDYKWEIRTDDPGTTFSSQGPSTENLFNGIVVTYTDINTGMVTTLDPVSDTDLADTSETNSWNQHGVDRWDEITLTTPTIESQAVQIGRAALAEKNRAKTPGTLTVRGYIRDRAGNEQPVWKVRAGDAISVTNFPNDTPRLIVETDYNDEDKTIRIAVDQPFQLLEAYLDRVGNALGARGLV